MICSTKSLMSISCTIFCFGHLVSAFGPTSGHMKAMHSCSALFSVEDSSESSSLPTEPMKSPVQPSIPQKRLDPLMATLTRMDPEAVSGPTRNVPFFGEVPIDGGLVVLVPAAGIAFLGFVLSIVVALNSSDQLVASLSNVVEDISQTASQKTNMVYDESVCRGICSSQEADLQGLANFMENLRK